MVRVISNLRPSNNVAPPCAYASACRNIDDVVVFELNVLVAGEVGVIDILNGLQTTSQISLATKRRTTTNIIRAWSSNTFQLTLIDAIDRDFLH
jgi:hypothetical protein